jgi:hypothetical protein
VKHLAVLVAAGFFLAGLAQAQGAVIAYDPFLTGSGEYSVGDLAGSVLQNPAVFGFSGGWKNGTTATSTWEVGAAGLNAAGQAGEDGGRAFYTGFGDGIRRVYRNLASYSAPSPLTYYMSGLVRLDSNSDLTGLNVTGFTNQQSTTDSEFFSTTTDQQIQGLQWGFEGDGSEIDLVLRFRQARSGIGIRQFTETILDNVQVGDTYFVVLRLDANTVTGDTRGNDRVRVWLDPSTHVEALAGPPTLDTVGYPLFGSTAINSMLFGSDGFGNVASYDENRFGTTWADVVMVPEPSTILVWSLLAALGIGTAWRRKR